MNQILEDIKKNLDWLSANKKSNNITNIVIVLNDISIQSATLGELKADAFDLMSDAENDYKTSVAEFVSNYDGTAAKAERLAEVEFKDKRTHLTEAKKLYKRFDIWLDRVDKILDAHKQRVSVEKQTGLKHMSGV